MRELLLGIDSGTQSTKVLVVDSRDGKVLAAAAQSYDLIPNLPPGTLPPVILPFDPTSSTPVCLVALDAVTGVNESVPVRYWAGGTVPWYTPTDITAASGLFIESSAEMCTDEGLESCSANLFAAYTVMMTSRATIGAIGINLAPACTNQGFIACIPNERYPLAYLYHWLKLAKPHFESLSGGATFAELTKGTFKRIRILTPPSVVIDAYDALADPMFKQMESLIKANCRLKVTRDSLLPRLISGKLKVDHLDIRLPPSMRAEAAA